MWANWTSAPDVRFVAAANPVSQNSAAWDLSAPLANRFAHLQWPITVEEWRIGFLNGWPRPAPLNIEAPKDGNNALRRTKTQIAAFVSSRPSLLSDVPDAETAASLAWPSSRSWDRLAVCETLCVALHTDDGVSMLVAAALVGQGPAVEYIAYIRDLDLPDPLDVLADPASIRRIERFGSQVRSVGGRHNRCARPTREPLESRFHSVHTRRAS